MRLAPPHLIIELRRDGHTVLRLPDWNGVGTETGGGSFGQSFDCMLRPGWYRFYVHAVDASGNRESRAGWNLLHVLPAE